jgi:hypothetical protein
MDDEEVNVFGGDETEMEQFEPTEEGEYNEMEDLGKKTTSFQVILAATIIVAVLLVFYYREKFALPKAQAVSGLPYTSGANLRILSEDSALNR